jgi:hypothetical protein
MAVSIPSRFRQKLSPSVSTIIFDDAINESKSISNYLETTPYYFDEYTMHGTRHINAVLEYADKLISQEENCCVNRVNAKK